MTSIAEYVHTYIYTHMYLYLFSCIFTFLCILLFVYYMFRYSLTVFEGRGAHPRPGPLAPRLPRFLQRGGPVKAWLGCCRGLNSFKYSGPILIINKIAIVPYAANIPRDVMIHDLGLFIYAHIHTLSALQVPRLSRGFSGEPCRLPGSVTPRSVLLGLDFRDWFLLIIRTI